MGMKSTDFFAGLTWGNLSRYKIRNEQTINKEKAEALDKRILTVFAQERTFDWANKALEYYSRETESLTPEVLKYSKEAGKLKQIQEAAKKVIQDKKDRDAKALRDAAQKADDAIDALNKATRTAQWCKEVNQYNREAQNIPSAVRAQMKNFGLLPQLMQETELFHKAEAMDQRILRVFKQERTYAWAQEAVEFVGQEKTTSQNVVKYSKEFGKLQQIQEAAKKIIQDKLDRDAKALRDAAQAADDTIDRLSRAARTAQWCDEVNKFYQKAQSLPSSVIALMENYDVLPRLENETILFRKAEALDQRILTVFKQERTYDWANKALLFCSKENGAITQDILKYSREADKLQEIQVAAKKVIQEKKDRDAKNVRDAAQNADDTIATLASAVRSRYWCSEVADFDREVQMLSREVRTLIKKLDILEKLVAEKDQMLQSIEIEDDIRNLLDSSAKESAWLKKAEKYVTAKPNSKIGRLIRDKALLEEIVAEYWRVYYAPTVKKYKEMLNFLAKDLWDQETVRSQFHVLDSELETVGFRMDDYIDGFTGSWQAGRQKVLAEEKRLKEAEDARTLAAKIQKEKDELQNYLDCLGDIAAGRASRQAVRDEFNRLSAKLNKLKFDPETYHPGFRNKWKNASIKVDEAQKRDDEAAAKARREAEARAKIAREEARHRYAKEQRKKNAKVFWKFVLLLLVTLSATFVGVGLAAKTDVWGVAAYIPILGALLYIHLAGVDRWEKHNFEHILMQIMFYVTTVASFLFFDQSIIAMAISMIFVAFVFNKYPDIVDAYESKLGKSICILLAAAAVIGGMGHLYPYMMGMSIWNSVWLLPLLSIAILILATVGIGENEGIGCGVLFGLLMLVQGAAYGFMMGDPTAFIGCAIIAAVLTCLGGLITIGIAKS